MPAIEVIPRVRLPRRLDSFWYTIDHPDIRVGNIVNVPFRHTVVTGIVRTVSSESPSETPLREACLSLNLQHPPENFIGLMEDFSRFSAISLGTSARMILPPRITRLRKDRFLITPQATSSSTRIPRKIADEILPIVQSVLSKNESFVSLPRRIERWFFYYALLKTAAAENPICVIFPTHQEIQDFVAWLPLPERDRIAVFSENLSGSDSVHFWNAVLEKKFPCFIGTKKMTFLPFFPTMTFILDSEASPYHHQFDHNPRFRVQDILAYRKNHDQNRMIYTGSAPSLALWKKRSSLTLFRPITDSPPTPQFIDLSHEQKSVHGGMITYPLEQMMKDKLAQKKKILLYCHRKNRMTYLVCPECQHMESSSELIYCSICRHPLIIRERRAIPHLVRELQKLFPSIQIGIHTADQPLTSLPAMIVATNHPLSAKAWQEIDFVAIVDFRHLLTSPSYDVHEQAWQDLFDIASHLSHTPSVGWAIQTPDPEHPILSTFLQNNWDRFYSQEMEWRKKFFYPPFSRILKIMSKNSLNLPVNWKDKWTTFGEEQGPIKTPTGLFWTMKVASPPSNELLSHLKILPENFFVDWSPIG